MPRFPLAVTALVLLAGCGGGTTAPTPNPPPPPPPPPSSAPVASVALTPDSAGVVLTGTLQLVPTLKDAAGNGLSGRTVTWISVDPAVAAVSSTGEVTGVTIGKTTIEARSEGVIGRAIVTVGAGWGSHQSTVRTGRVTLPPGTPIAPGAIRVLTSLGTALVSSTGEFTLPVLSRAPQLAVATTADGRPLLMGWLSGAAPSLSAQTTAEAMAYLDLGGGLLPPQARAFVMSQLAGRGEVAELTNAIAAALAAPAASVTVDVPAVDQARRNVRAHLFPATAAARAGRGPSGVVAIDPLANKSGLDVNEVDLNLVQVTNQYRRRALAVVDRISYTDVDSKVVPSFSRIATEDVPGTFGVTTFGGLLVDVVLGQLAWAEVQSSSIPIPLSPADARATRYRLRVLGLGVASQAELDELTGAERRELDVVAAKSFFLDLVLPVLMNVILDGDVAGDAIEKALKEPGLAAALSDFIDLMSTRVPNVAEKVYQGDIQGAAEEIWTAILAGDSFQAFVFDFTAAIAMKILEDPRSFEAVRAVQSYGGAFLKFLGKVDRVLTMTDTSLQLWQVSFSRAIEAWDLVTLPSKVKLNPPTSRIGKPDIQLMKAVVLGLEGVEAGAALAYQWATTGLHGKLVDANHQGTRFESSSDAVTYVPSRQTAGIDQITVEVSRIEAGVGKVVIGSATATIEVADPTIELAPEDAVLLHGQQQTFTVTVPAELVGGAILSYRWTTTGTVGAFPRGLKSAQGAANQIVYTAVADLIGVDDVSVEVLATTDGVTTTLGADRVIVEVKRAPFTLEPPISFVEADSVLRFVARPHGDKPAQPRYRWDFGDGSAPITTLNDSVATHAFTADGFYRVSVDLEDVATGNRLATAGATVTVGPPAEDTLPIWKITRLELVGVTGQAPPDEMEGTTVIGYSHYFATRRKLTELAAGQTIAYIHALDGTATMPDCFDFDFDRNTTERIAWPAWIWLQFPLEAPSWCGEDRIVGHYPHDEAWALANGTSLMLGFDEAEYFRRFQQADIFDVWDYPEPAFVDVSTTRIAGRRFATYSGSDTPEKHQVYAVHEIEAQASGKNLTGRLKLIYQVYDIDTVVETWTATWELDAVRGR